MSGATCRDTVPDIAALIRATLAAPVVRGAERSLRLVRSAALTGADHRRQLSKVLTCESL